MVENITSVITKGIMFKKSIVISLLFTLFFIITQIKIIKAEIMVNRVFGKAEYRKLYQKKWVKLSKNMKLDERCRIRTGNKSSLTLSLHDGSICKLINKVIFDIKEVHYTDNVKKFISYLQYGKIKIIKRRSNPFFKFIIRTPTAEAQIKKCVMGINVIENNICDFIVFCGDTKIIPNKNSSKHIILKARQKTTIKKNKLEISSQPIHDSALKNWKDYNKIAKKDILKKKLKLFISTDVNGKGARKYAERILKPKEYLKKTVKTGQDVLNYIHNLYEKHNQKIQISDIIIVSEGLPTGVYFSKKKYSGIYTFKKEMQKLIITYNDIFKEYIKKPISLSPKAIYIDDIKNLIGLKKPLCKNVNFTIIACRTGAYPKEVRMDRMFKFHVMFAGGELSLFNYKKKIVEEIEITTPGFGEYFGIEPFAQQLSMITEGKVEASSRRLAWGEQQCKNGQLRINKKKRVIYKNGKRI